MHHRHLRLGCRSAARTLDDAADAARAARGRIGAASYAAFGARCLDMLDVLNALRRGFRDMDRPAADNGTACCQGSQFHKGHTYGHRRSLLHQSCGGRPVTGSTDAPIATKKPKSG